MRIGSLFSGIGGLELGLELGLERAGLGPVIWQAEREGFRRSILERHWPGVTRYTDVKEVDHGCATPDLICGGFPCQDVSDASRGRGGGLTGERSGLWAEFARIVQTLRPTWVNSTPEGIPACHFECAPLTLEPPTEALASSWLPRPTAKANQLAPSMRKWPSCRNLQDFIGRTGGSPHPELWEWLMGLPTGWTDLGPVEMPSSRPVPK